MGDKLSNPCGYDYLCKAEPQDLGCAKMGITVVAWDTATLGYRQITQM